MNRILPISLTILAAAMLLVPLYFSAANSGVHAQQPGTPIPAPTPPPEIEPRNEQVPLLAGKISPPRYDGMAYTLNKLVMQYEAGALTARAAADTAPVHHEDSVAVTFHIEPDYVQDVFDYLRAHDVPAREPLEDERFIEAEVPVSLLAEASQQPGVIVVKPIMPPRPAQFSVGGQGATAHGARAWHAAGFRGQGVKVGVIDLEFKNFDRLRGTELPSSVQARCYSRFSASSNRLSDCEGSGSHGSAVTEVLYETAPGATYYISRIVSKGTVGSAVQWMAAQGVDVIVTSVHWLWDGPGNGTSPYTNSPLKSIDSAVSAGSIVAVAAGNETQSTWFGSFSDPDGDGDLDFVDGDECNSVSLTAGLEFVAQLRWQDTWNGATRDLDMYLSDSGSSIVASSEETQSGGPAADPFEWLSYTPPADGTYCLRVKRRDGTLPGWVQLQSFSGEPLERTTESHALGNPAETRNSGALTVGAATWLSTTTHFLDSSRGPLPDGTIKPDIMGVSGVETASYGDMVFGSSFAAPHIAGIAALAMQRYPFRSPAGIASYLKENALARGAKPNNTWGHGFAFLPAITPPTPTHTNTPTATHTPTATATVSPTLTATPTITPTPTASPTATPTPPITPTVSPAPSPAPSPTPTGTPEVARKPQPPSEQIGIIVRSGGNHACALHRTTGSILCWGSNEHGQASPPATGTYSAITSGNTHSCALRSDGAVVCWGSITVNP